MVVGVGGGFENGCEVLYVMMGKVRMGKRAR
jgi:hypothetical protein